MNAARVVDTSLGREIRVERIPAPDVAPHSLKVRVMAAGCGFQDVAMLRGQYQVCPPVPYTPLGEFAGVVEEVGEGACGFEPGDRVFGVCGLNCAAELALVPPKYSRRMPDEMSFEEGAALGIAYPTAYGAVAVRANVQPGETLIVAGAAGGVGLAAIQIGKALGARVIGIAGSPEKQLAAKAAGCDEVLSELEGDGPFDDDQRADVIVDPVGGDQTHRLLKRAKWGARIVTVGFSSGTIPKVSLNRLLLKNISIMGLNWASYGMRQEPAYDRAVDWLVGAWRRGETRPRIYERYRLDQVPEALADLAERRVIGKNVVTPNEEVPTS